MDHLTAHFKIILTVAAAQAAGIGLAEINMLASICAYICGALASLCIGYHHLRKSRAADKTKN